MKTISLADATSNPSSLNEISRVLADGGLVCFPTPTVYKLSANLEAPDAVTAMLRAKRRVKNAPALVFVPDRESVERVGTGISPEATRLMDAFWPGEVTLLLEASQQLHPKVRKLLAKAKGWLGVRMPSDPLALDIVRTFGRPVLVSSANLSDKRGAYSAAQVRKNFGRTVDLFIDGGDRKGGPNSTLVNVTSDNPTVIRVGSVPIEEIKRVLEAG